MRAYPLQSLDHSRCLPSADPMELCISAQARCRYHYGPLKASLETYGSVADKQPCPWAATHVAEHILSPSPSPVMCGSVFIRSVITWVHDR